MLVICKINCKCNNEFGYSTSNERKFKLNVNFDGKQDIENIKDIKAMIAIVFSDVIEQNKKRRNFIMRIQMFREVDEIKICHKSFYVERTENIAKRNVDWIYSDLVEGIKYFDKDITIVDYMYKPKYLGI